MVTNSLIVCVHKLNIVREFLLSMGFISNFFNWIFGFFRRKGAEPGIADSENEKLRSENKELKSEVEEIGSKLENIEAKLEKSEKNVEAEEGFEEAKIEEEEKELKEVDASISEEESAEATGDTKEIESAKQREEEEMDNLKKHLADLTQQLARFETDEKREFSELKGKTDELHDLIDELRRVETSGRFSSQEKLKDKEGRAREDWADRSSKIIGAGVGSLDLEKLEGRIEEVRAEIAKVENSLANPDGRPPSELKWGLKDLERNLNSLYSEISRTKEGHKSAMKRIESSINKSLETARATLKKQNISAGSVVIGKEPVKEGVIHAEPLEKGNDDFWGSQGVTWK